MMRKVNLFLSVVLVSLSLPAEEEADLRSVIVLVQAAPLNSSLLSEGMPFTLQTLAHLPQDLQLDLQLLPS